MAAGFRELSNRRMRSPNEAEHLLDVPNLGLLSLHQPARTGLSNLLPARLPFRKGSAT
jgi:hypothetical protein